MSFESILQGILQDCGHGLGVALMGLDGIPIEQVDVAGAASLDIDPVAVGVEFGRILSETRKAAEAVNAGDLEELALRAKNFWVVLRMIDEENFLLLALAPEGNLGKARFVLRRYAASIRAEF
jgi:predicted regulator of Ras-like GTPase activity (Roadblock/LC7/MglB family)